MVSELPETMSASRNVGSDIRKSAQRGSVKVIDVLYKCIVRQRASALGDSATPRSRYCSLVRGRRGCSEYTPFGMVANDGSLLTGAGGLVTGWPGLTGQITVYSPVSNVLTFEDLVSLGQRFDTARFIARRLEACLVRSLLKDGARYEARSVPNDVVPGAPTSLQ